jgi:hypothetical protein
MKVNYKKNFTGYSGTSDDAVYYYHPRLELSLVREYVKPKESSQNQRVKAIMANLKLIQPSAGYKQNFKDYLIKYNNLKENQNKLMLTWNNLYLKMLYGLAKAYPAVDLATLSREQIYAEDLPCVSLKRAVEAGLLPVVEGYEWQDKLL